MKKELKIYLDTSVIGGCYDDEFAEWSKKLIEEFKAGLYIPVVSELTEAEISNAPEQVQNVLIDLLKSNCQVLVETEESIALAQKYINVGILSRNFEDDARHVAMATTNSMDMIVSWNFKHIVHFEKIRWFNSVNLAEGYKLIEIFSPREVIQYEY
jgi:hypothetical protein